MNSRSPICLFVSPSPSRRNTSISRLERRPHRLQPGPALRAERAHERGCRISVANRTERLELGSRVACGVDGHVRRAERERARQLEPRARGIEAKTERREAIHRLPKKLRRLFASLGEREATVSSGGECRDAVTAAALGDDVERSRGRSRIVEPILS